MSPGRRSFGRIFRRPASAKFYVRFTAPGRRYPVERVAGSTERAAETVLARLRVLLSDGVPLPDVLHRVFGDPPPTVRGTTLRDAVDPYLLDSEGRRKPSTIEGYSRILAAIAREEWSGHDLRDIQPALITSWLARRRETGVSGATLNRELCVLSSVWKWAIREGLADTNPMARIPKYSEKGRARETYLTAAEARALVEAAPADFAPFLVCALATGMRKGEIQRITWRSVDLARLFHERAA